MPDNNTSKHAVMTRIPFALDTEIREIADREGEAKAVILRRLVKRGLEFERRSAQDASR
jgi:hypothetical protein